MRSIPNFFGTTIDALSMLHDPNPVANPEQPTSQLEKLAREIAESKPCMLVWPSDEPKSLEELDFIVRQSVTDEANLTLRATSHLIELLRARDRLDVWSDAHQAIEALFDDKDLSPTQVTELYSGAIAILAPHTRAPIIEIPGQPTEVEPHA